MVRESSPEINHEGRVLRSPELRGEGRAKVGFGAHYQCECYGQWREITELERFFAPLENKGR